jgi:hypothetical protein
MAAKMPRNSPSARLSFLFGLLGAEGSMGSLMTSPASVFRLTMVPILLVSARYVVSHPSLAWELFG